MRIPGKRTLALSALTLAAAILVLPWPAQATPSTGEGTMTVAPSYVTAGSTNNDLTFTYTTDSTGMTNGEIDLEIPNTWTEPGANSGTMAGIGGTCYAEDENSNYVVSSSGGNWVVQIPMLTLPANTQCTIQYGISGFNTGPTAPTVVGANQTVTFQALESNTTATATDLTAGSPTITLGNDGTGTMAVSPTHAYASSTGNTLTFTYTATAAMSSGELTTTLPSGWSAPTASAGLAGHTTTTCPGGSVGASGQTIQVTGINLSASSSCTIVYGSTASSSPGATAPTTGGINTFTTQQEASGSDSNLVAIAHSPTLIVTALDGSGTMTVSPTSVITGSTNNDLTFTYTTAPGGMSNGEIDLDIPNTWTEPSTSPSNLAGIGGTCWGESDNGDYTVATSGSNWVVKIPTLTLLGNTQCTIEYGVSGGNTGPTAPSSPGPNTFTLLESSTSGGTPTALASPTTVIVGNDGTGTMAVSPTHAYASSTGNTLTFTYTASTTLSSGEVTIALPTGWSAPTATAGQAGHTTTTCSGGSIGASGQTIQVTGINLSASSSCTIVYGSTAGSSPGATAPTNGGIETFTTQEESSSSGTLTTLGTGSPSLIVTALDGSGTMTVSPTSVITGSTNNDLTFTYTTAPGGMSNGEIDLDIPNTWTEPGSSAASMAGIGGTCWGESDNGDYTVATSGSNWVVKIPTLTLLGNTQCTIEYGVSGGNTGPTAPSSPGVSTFTLLESSTSGDTPTALGTPATVNVSNDGIGTITVSPVHAYAASTGNTFTFTFTAAVNMSAGEVAIAAPSGWSAPTATAGQAGHTTTTCPGGSVGASGQTIQVTGINLSASSTCTIVYGSTAGSSPGATAPPTGGINTFTTQEESSSSGTLTTLGSTAPTVSVTALDGTGTMTVSPTTLLNNSTGNFLTFTYTAAAGGMDNGEIDLRIPKTWTQPGATAGSTAGIGGTCPAESMSGSYTVDTATDPSNWIVEISGLTLSGNGQCTIDYGINGFNSGTTAPSASGASTFTPSEESTATGTLTTLSTLPSVNVDDDGTGTMTVSPLTESAAATGQTLTFTYTSATGVSLSSGELTVALPAGWSAPSTTGSAAGFTTTNCSGGVVGASGQTIQVTGINLGSASSCTITYGSKASSGPGATVTSTLGTSTFTVDEQSSNGGGSLIAIGTAPSLMVYAADGSGGFVVAPTFAGSASTGNTLTFTYTAAAGGMNGGKLTLVVPAGWSAPSTTPTVAGATTSTCGSVGVASTTITVTGVILGGATTCTITYGSTSGGGVGATAPSTPGAQTFAAQEQSSANGALTSLGSSPSLNIEAADGSGTMVVSPNAVNTGSTAQTLVFTYTAAAGGLNGGEVTVAVPAGWSAPSTTTSAAGYSTSTCGTVGLSGSTIQVTGVTLAGGATCTITYGLRASGGPGAAAPSSDTTSTFTTTERSTGTGTLTAVASSPSVGVSTPPAPPAAGGTTTTTQTVTTPAASPADLAVKVTAPTKGTARKTLTYVYTVTNNGPNAATGVVLSAHLVEGGASVVSSTPRCVAGLDLACSLGTLGSGQSVKVTIVLKARGAGTYQFAATVSGGQPDPSSINNSVTSSTTVTAPPKPKKKGK